MYICTFINDVNATILQNTKDIATQLMIYGDKISQYTDIKHFIIMGFSLNDIDRPYIEKIIEVNHDIDAADWTIYYHAKGENESLKRKLMELGIPERNINEPIYW